METTRTAIVGGRALVAVPTSPAEWRMATGLLIDYFEWLAEAAGVGSVPAVQPKAARELADLAQFYQRPGHRLLLASQGGVGLGIVGLQATGEGATVELVRFYSRPIARGTGVGTALLTTAIEEAESMGFARIVLDTAIDIMPEAARLYRRHGFAVSTEAHELPIETGTRFERDLGARSDRSPSPRSR